MTWPRAYAITAHNCWVRHERGEQPTITRGCLRPMASTSVAGCIPAWGSRGIAVAAVSPEAGGHGDDTTGHGQPGQIGGLRPAMDHPASERPVEHERALQRAAADLHRRWSRPCRAEQWVRRARHRRPDRVPAPGRATTSTATIDASMVVVPGPGRSGRVADRPADRSYAGQGPTTCHPHRRILKCLRG